MKEVAADWRCQSGCSCFSTAGGDIVVGPGGVMQTGPGYAYLTNIQGMPAEQFQRMAEELAKYMDRLGIK